MEKSPTLKLTDLALTLYQMGDVKGARTIAKKLLQVDRERLAQLSHIDIDNTNFDVVMAELKQIEYLTKVSDYATK